MVGSLIEARLLGSMREDEECDYDDTLNDDSSARGGDKENCIVGEDDSNMCKDVVIEMKLMQQLVENDVHEDVELKIEFWHALDVLIDEVEMLKCPLNLM